MQLIIERNKIRIVTETVQDVAYLQHMGCGCVNLKTSVFRRTLPDFEYDINHSEEEIEIHVKWEDKDVNSDEMTGNDWNCIQHIEGKGQE